MNMICCDFIKWFEDNVGYQFDKIVMNLLYLFGCYREYMLVVLGYLKVGGCFVVVLLGIVLILSWMMMDNYVYVKGKLFINEFEDIGIIVSVYVFKCVK